MKMKRKWIFLTLLTAMLGAVITACSGSAGSGAGSNASESVTLHFWFPGEGSANEQYFTDAAKAFEAEHPDIKVQTTILPPGAGDIDTKLNAAKLSGTYPDVFSAYLIFMGTRGALDEFLPLDDRIDAWEDKDDISESALAMGRYKGKTVGLGYFAAPEILTYRKDYFQEAGLDPKKPPTDWEELAAYAERLTVKDANGKIVRAGLDVPLNNASSFFESFMRQNGSPIIDEAKEVPVFADEPSVEAFRYLADLYNKVAIPYNYEKKDTAPFVSGNSAMSFLTNSTISNMIKNHPELKDQLGYAPVLEQKEKYAFTGYRLFTIGKTSKHPEEAWKFIEFMMSKEQMWKRYEALQIPVVRKSLEQRFIEDRPEINAVLVDYVKYGKGKPITPFTSTYNKYIHQAYEETLTGAKSPEQALKDAQDGLVKELETIR
ncbi:ABC transporter substrate-binding protein [Paenibacillus antri]|nr:ABC transporter substrate-binding protein [Paenibacillus antri]